MAVIRISRVFHFEAAHYLPHYEGACQNIHGHSYELTVTITGEVNQQIGPHEGMVLDYSFVNELLKEHVLVYYDHALILKEGVKKIQPAKTMTLAHAPTSENIIVDIAQRIKEVLPASVQLHALKLYETNKNFCEWLASDQ